MLMGINDVKVVGGEEEGHYDEISTLSMSIKIELDQKCVIVGKNPYKFHYFNFFNFILI